MKEGIQTTELGEVVHVHRSSGLDQRLARQLGTNDKVFVTVTVDGKNVVLSKSGIKTLNESEHDPVHKHGEGANAKNYPIVNRG